MLRLFCRVTPSAIPITSSFVARSAFPAVRTMATYKADNKALTSNRLFDVSHVTAVVTGGGTGIGLMITQALVANGAKVYITGRRENALEQVSKLYSDGPGSIHPLPGDVSKKAEVMDIAAAVDMQEPDGIQLLVNNTGIARDDNTKFSAAGQPDMSSAETIHNHFIKSDPQAWEDTFRTNVTGQFFTTMAFLPLLERGGKSVQEKVPDYTPSIINVSSISGYMKDSSGGQPAYACSKAAFTHLTRMLATTLKETKIRVNAICPGMFPSEMTTNTSDKSNKSEIAGEASNPSGRYGADSDMAASLLLLAGPGGTFYNEQFLYPDGGQTMAIPAARA